MKLDWSATLLLLIAAMLAYIVYQSNALVAGAKASVLASRMQLVAFKKGGGTQEEIDKVSLAK